MANTAQATKRARQSKKNALRNQSQKSAMRTTIKKTLKAIQEKNKELAQAGFREAASLMDRLAGRNIIRANTASRLKSRLNAKVKALFV